MAKTFMQMVQEAKAEVPGVSPVEAQRRFQEDPDALLLEVRDAGSIPVDEKAPNMVNISLGTLPIRADLEVPEEHREHRLPRPFTTGNHDVRAWQPRCHGREATQGDGIHQRVLYGGGDAGLEGRRPAYGLGPAAKAFE